MSEFTQISVAKIGKTGVIRFACPKARNALTDKMLAETRAQMEAWEQDKAIAVIVLTGDDKAFCAGGDLKGTASSQMGAFDKYRHRHTHRNGIISCGS